MMVKVTTNLSYEEEDFGRGEQTTFTREVGDLDVVDWLWYLLKITELAGFDVKDLNLITNSNAFYTTED